VLGISSSVIARIIFNLKVWQSPAERSADPILLVCEEAHRYVPNSGEAQYETAQDAIRRIAKEGRKYGLGLILVSQRPSEVEATVLSQCNSWIILRITNDAGRAHVRSILPDSMEGLTKMLSGLRRQEAIFVDQASVLPSRIMVRNLLPNQTDTLLHLTLRDRERAEYTYSTTQEHPFWTENRGWVSAGELTTGDIVRQLDGQQGEFVASRVEPLGRIIPVYNFQVEGLHTYFVLPVAGETTVAQDLVTNAFLVHNSDDDGCGGSASKPIHKNSNAFQGKSHVYAIKAPDGSVHKIGKSSTGTRVTDGASKRAEAQVRKLNREDLTNGGNGGYSSEIRKDGFQSSGDAVSYETNM
jgi:hypothetical protein